MDKWKNKVAIVTGASSGIGASICEKLVEEGLQVAGLARRVEKVKELAEKLERKPGKLTPVYCDVTDPKSIHEAFEQVKNQLGPVCVLINNAGTLRGGPLLETQYEDWKLCLDTNVLGLTKCTQEAFQQMEESKIDGQIVLINSIAGHYPILIDPPISNMYSPSKFAVSCLAETFRREFVYYRTKIKISSISPGLVDTEIFATSGIAEANDPKKKRIPHLQPEDVANTVIFVLSVPPHVQIHDILMRPVGDKGA